MFRAGISVLRKNEGTGGSLTDLFHLWAIGWDRTEEENREETHSISDYGVLNTLTYPTTESHGSSSLFNFKGIISQFTVI